MLDRDAEFLARSGLKHDAREVGKETLVVFEGFDLGAAYAPRQADLLVRLPPGYPTTPLDMFWTRQTVKLAASNSLPQQCDHFMEIAGERWQRWSRHFDASRWRSHVDGLETYVRAIRTELARGR